MVGVVLMERSGGRGDGDGLPERMTGVITWCGSGGGAC